MSASKLRPGYLETEDIRSALAADAPAGADIEALTAAFLADPANIAAIERANGEVADAELRAYQGANDALSDLVERFLAKRGR